MSNTQLPKELALQVILRLKQGRNVVFGAPLFSVGRERWIKGAEQILKDLEATRDAFIRFIIGNPGVGKTNFAARLFHLGLGRNWVSSYIELSDTIAFHEFHNLFAAVASQLYLPETASDLKAEPSRPDGILGMLDRFVERCKTSFGLSLGADVPSTFRTELRHRLNSLLLSAAIHGDFAAATRAYVEARLDQDAEKQALLSRWWGAEPSSAIKAVGVFRSIDKTNAKEHLRHLTALVVALGYKGTLVIIDELERIMDQNESRRKKAYVLLRELIDNVDGQGGMRQTCIYCAAPPSQLESARGFIEVEPLISRIRSGLSSSRAKPGYLETIVDLEKAGLTEENRRNLARKIRDIHSAAREWDASAVLDDRALDALIKKLTKDHSFNAGRVRETCIEVVNALEAAFQEEESDE